MKNTELRAQLGRYDHEADMLVKIGDKYHKLTSVKLDRFHANAVELQIEESGMTLEEEKAENERLSAIQLNQPKDNTPPVIIPKASVS